MLRHVALAFFVAIFPLSVWAEAKKQPVDYVNPSIGGIGQLLTATTPIVQLPYGMVRLAPITTPGMADHYLADKIYGFPAAGASLMPTTGPLETVPAEYASEFDRDFETASPYYGREVLEKYGIAVDYTVARRAAFYRFRFPRNRPAHVLVMAGQGGELTAMGGDVVAGFAESEGVRNFFYAIFSRPFTSTQSWQGTQVVHHGRKGEDVGLAVDFAQLADEQVSVRVGASYISIDRARRNLIADIPEPNFESAKSVARSIWNRELGKIVIEGGSERQRTIFYTALYRSMERPNDITEDGGEYYSGYDHRTHLSDGHSFYVNDNFWDTYRSLHPLQLLLDPERQVDMVRSLLSAYEQSGWLPTVPSLAGDRGVMIGHHAAPFITDVYMKGYRDFDAEKAYAGMRKNALEATMLPWRRGPLTELDRVYLEKGFFPALAQGEKEAGKEVHPFEHRQAVAVTLENSYDDWAIAQMARALHKDEDDAYFLRRAHNYENVFDKRIGFMAPKSADGNWVQGFDPKLGGGQGGREYFAEMNSWTYSFQVQHDIAGLIHLMGGRESFVRRLDALFTEQYGEPKFVFLGQFPDSTGLIGQYAQGNEPSFHIPYLYNYAGQPWKAQFRLRQIMNVWYGDGPLGIPGDDDGGAMSSWYVLSAMGFYPVSVGQPVYNLGSPLFSKASISLARGKKFTIVARNASPRNKYIQSAEMNGKSLSRPWFTHSDIVGGGTLVLEMGAQPNMNWGSTPEAAPPSMSQ